MGKSQHDRLAHQRLQTGGRGCSRSNRRVIPRNAPGCVADELEWAELARRSREAGNAIDLGGNGYPLRFTATAEYLAPRIKKPPEANAVWICGPEDILTDKWAGKTVVDLDAIAQCRIGEWLLVVAWDQS